MLAGPAGGAGAPQVSIDAQGESVAAWSIDYGVGALVRPAVSPQIPSSPDVVQVALRPAGGSYGVAQTLSDSSTSAFSASVAIAAGGEAIAVWVQDQAGEKAIGEKSEVEYSVRPAGGAFGAAQVLSTPGVPAEQPSLAVNPAGEAIVAWLSEKDTKLEYATRPAGKAFGPTLSLTAKTPAGMDDVRGALDARGDAILAWDEEEEPSAGVYLGRIVAAQAPPAAAFGSPITLSEPGAHDFLPMVALDSQGDATLVWVQDSEDITTKKAIYRVLARTLSSTGASGTLQTLSEAGQNPEDPNVGVDAAGEATAAWTRSTSSSNKFEAAVLPAGSGAFGQSTVLDESAGGFIESAVAVNEGGEAMAIWSHETGEGEQIEEAERATGGSFSAPVPVSSAGSAFIDPSVAIDPAGDAAASWDAFGHERIFVESSNFLLPSPPAPAPPAGTAAGGSTGTSSGVAPATGTTALLVSLDASKRKLAKLLKKGSLEVACTVSAPSSCRIELVLLAKVARKLGFHLARHAKTITVGSASIAFATAGTKTVSLKLSSSALRVLRAAHRPLGASLTAIARDSSGASATAPPIALKFY